MTLNAREGVVSEGATILDQDDNLPASKVQDVSTLKHLANATISSAKNATSIKTDSDADKYLIGLLLEIIEHRRLSAVFQPIIEMCSGAIIGYEGLIRGPAGSPLRSPLKLFEVARTNNMSVNVEHLCRRVVLERFVELGLPGKLFLNTSPKSLVERTAKHGETLDYIRKIGVSPERVIIELTESEPTYDYDLLRTAALHYRNMGFQIAIDDLGQGFSSLRLWSELRPEYVKVDMHFVKAIDSDPIKRQFVLSIQAIAEKSGTQVIAEGIETKEEFEAIRDLGVAYGQGYYIAYPQAEPSTEIPENVLSVCDYVEISSSSHPRRLDGCVGVESAARLLRSVPVVTPQMTNNQVYEIFASNQNLSTVPVVDVHEPIGLINRAKMIECFAQPFQRELYGRRACKHFMDAKPLVVDKNTSLQELGHMVAEAEAHHLSNGFIITGDGCYLGMGTGHDLMRELTQMQLAAARYANPLTQLPGNVPINDQIDRILQQQIPFCACYCDLDHFKPFNDVYGYQKGDDVIRLTAKVLSEECDQERDFVGHIGGDDFMILFQSDDWEQRCNRILNRFARAIMACFSPEVWAQGGYISEDRQGKKMFQSLVSLSLGITRVLPGQYSSHHQIAETAVEAKKQAKKIHGNSLFVERRGLG